MKIDGDLSEPPRDVIIRVVELNPRRDDQIGLVVLIVRDSRQRMDVHTRRPEWPAKFTLIVVSGQIRAIREIPRRTMVGAATDCRESQSEADQPSDAHACKIPSCESDARRGGYSGRVGCCSAVTQSVQQLDKTALRLLQGDDRTGGVGDDGEQCVEFSFATEYALMGLIELTITLGRVPPLDHPEQPDKTCRAELSHDR